MTGNKRETALYMCGRENNVAFQRYFQDKYKVIYIEPALKVYVGNWGFISEHLYSGVVLCALKLCSKSLPIIPETDINFLISNVMWYFSLNFCIGHKSVYIPLIYFFPWGSCLFHHSSRGLVTGI